MYGHPHHSQGSCSWSFTRCTPTTTWHVSACLPAQVKGRMPNRTRASCGQWKESPCGLEAKSGPVHLRPKPDPKNQWLWRRPGCSNGYSFFFFFPFVVLVFISAILFVISFFLLTLSLVCSFSFSKRYKMRLWEIFFLDVGIYFFKHLSYNNFCIIHRFWDVVLPFSFVSKCTNFPFWFFLLHNFYSGMCCFLFKYL